jgi:hypothetical protein
MHTNQERTTTYHPHKMHLTMKPETLIAYRAVSFVQLPMKSGILPVKGVSDARLKPKHIYIKLCHIDKIFIYMRKKKLQQ